ncbi:MAG TPA: CHAP domain-containing protein [Solirubrobacterales bacterium]|nr:CHAP domain-containing protein [Solirubrobacterales bacterium]
MASPVGASAAGGHHRRGHKRHHRRPHRQAVAGPIAGAKVPVAKAPTIVGKGGGADPGDDYPAELKNAPQDSRVDHWGEYNRECTSFVAWALYSRNGFTMPFHDNANNWGPDAVHRGYVVNSSPAIGSVAWSNAGFYGHVAYVVAAGGGNVTIEEYNHWGNGTYDKRTVAASAFTGYIHFKDIPAEPPSTPVSTPSSPSQTPSTPTTGSPGSTPSQPASPAPTHSETTGGLAHTWTNYTNAGGYEGPAIPSNATVQIACAVQGFRVADGNTWWYRIASSPWSGNYYVSADAFYNNGQTSGSLIGTPFVDPAVSSC